MPHFEELAKHWPVRADLPEAHRAFWERLATPGAWLTGAQRVAVAAEVRAARDCALCAERKQAVSPAMVSGTHDRAPDGSSACLSERAVEVVHRVVTDQARLTQRFVEECTKDGLSEDEYVEILGLVVCQVSIDAVHRNLSVPLEPLPAPRPGEPSGYRPATLSRDTGWLPMIPPRGTANSPEADLWPPSRTANVLRALSLVPDAVRDVRELSAAHYMSPQEMSDLAGGRTLDRMQIELVAGRVSAIQECFY